MFYYLTLSAILTILFINMPVVKMKNNPSQTISVITDRNAQFDLFGSSTQQNFQGALTTRDRNMTPVSRGRMQSSYKK